MSHYYPTRRSQCRIGTTGTAGNAPTRRLPDHHNADHQAGRLQKTHAAVILLHCAANIQVIHHPTVPTVSQQCGMMLGEVGIEQCHGRCERAGRIAWSPLLKHPWPELNAISFLTSVLVLLTCGSPSRSHNGALRHPWPGCGGKYGGPFHPLQHPDGKCPPK